MTRVHEPTQDRGAVPGGHRAPTYFAHWVAISSALVMTVLAVACIYMTQPLFATISARFVITDTAARLAFAWPLITYALAFFAIGPLTDRLRPLSLAGGGSVGVAILLLLAAGATSYPIFVTALALAGAVAATVPAATFSLMGRVAPPHRLGVYFGMAIAASVSGITIGRTLGALIADRYGLDTMLVSMAILLAMVSLPAFLMRKVVGLPAGATLSLAAVYKSGFGILRDLLVIRYLLGGFLLFFGYIGVLTFLTLRLQQTPFNYSLEQIGWISAVGLIAIIGAPGSGFAIKRWGPQRSSVASLLVVLVAIVTLWFSQVFLGTAFGLLILFLGVFACQPTILVLLANSVSPVSRGAASSMYLLVCLGGGGVSSLILGSIWDSYAWDGICAAALLAVCLSFLIFLLTSVRKT